MLRRTYLHLLNYKSMIKQTFHLRSSLHCTALHCTSLPILHFQPLLDVSWLRFKNPSLLLTSNYFPNPIFKSIWFTGESRWHLCSQLIPWFDFRIYKGVFTDACSLFPIPNFTIMIIPAKVACSLWPVAFHARSTVYALKRAQCKVTSNSAPRFPRPYDLQI